MAEPEGGAPVTEPPGGQNQPAGNPPANQPVGGNPGNLLGDAANQDPPAGSGGDPKPPEGGEPPKKDGDDGKPQGAPETYTDFTLPEGYTIEPKEMDSFKEFAKTQNLSQEQAQKVLEFGGEKIKAQLEAPYKFWNEMQTKWQAEVKADPEIGGTNYDDSIKAAAEVFKPGGLLVKTPEEERSLREAFNITGAGNNPAIVRIFVRLGRALQEPGALKGAPANKKDPLALLYPSMAPKE